MRSSKITVGLSGLLLAWVIILLGVMALMYIKPAHSSPSCMSKAEARALWPTQHIWWHTMDHCWDNQPGRTYHARKARAQAPAPDPMKPMPAPPPRADANIIFPALVTHERDFDKSLFTTAAITGWPMLMDIDEVTAKADPPEECCWPQVEMTFESRWFEVPVAWLETAK